MPRFYFDHRNGDTFVQDDEGLEFATIQQARDSAARTLGEIARDNLPGAVRREIAIEVSDASRRPLFRTALWFEVESLNEHPSANVSGPKQPGEERGGRKPA